jgi:AcrR family transcriptional regulator
MASDLEGGGEKGGDLQKSGASAQATGAPPASLAEERQQLTRSRIRRAAMEVVARRGFDATVEEIAEVSGVSPRTIFRHYRSHDQLILATVKDMFEECGRPANELGDDLDGWLDSLAVTIHTRNAEIIGEAFWDIHAPHHNTSEVLSEMNSLRCDSRIRGVHYLAALAWRAAGGTNEPPKALVLSFALNFSAFSTQALVIDFDQTPAQVGRLTADILKVVLRRAVEAQGSAGGRRRY